MPINISKQMPNMTGGTSDRDSTFILGRRAFFNNTHKSYDNNLDNCNKIPKISSNAYAQPINDGSASLRSQRLRLLAIGGGSSKLKNANDQVSFVSKDGDKNYVNNRLSKVRGSGYIATKKGKTNRINNL